MPGCLRDIQTHQASNTGFQCIRRNHGDLLDPFNQKLWQTGSCMCTSHKLSYLGMTFQWASNKPAKADLQLASFGQEALPTSHTWICQGSWLVDSWRLLSDLLHARYKQCCWWHCYISLFSSTLNLRSFRASPLNLKRISAHRQTCCPHVSMQVLARKKMACLYAHVQCCFSNRAQHYHLNCHLLVSADTHGQLCGQSSCSPHTSPSWAYSASLAARRDPCTGAYIPL